MSNLGGLEAEILKTGGSFNNHTIANNSNGPIPNKSEPVEHTNVSSVAQTGKNYNGFRPDLPDQRDFTFSSLGLNSTKLPTSVDLRPFQSPVLDQGQAGSCTSFALTGGLEALELKDKKSLIPMSQLFVYYNERALENTVKSDAGASLRDGIKTLAANGCCAESMWPYNIAKLETKPNSTCYTSGLNYIIQSYYRVQTLADMKTCLSLGYPFIFGITVYSSFESANATSTGIIPMPSKKERTLGGHALLAVGFDDSKQWFIFKNSWSKNWGNAGYGFLPYSYMTNTSLSSDMWYISKDKGF
jgi:C1A family cysteine protease